MVDVAAQVVHRLAVADLAALVEDDFDAVERGGDGVGVAQVADDELGVGRQVVRPPVRVGLLVERVEDPDAVAAGQQRVDEVRADEAGAPGDEREAQLSDGSGGMVAMRARWPP